MESRLWEREEAVEAQKETDTQHAEILAKVCGAKYRSSFSQGV